MNTVIGLPAGCSPDQKVALAAILVVAGTFVLTAAVVVAAVVLACAVVSIPVAASKPIRQKKVADLANDNKLYTQTKAV